MLDLFSALKQLITIDFFMIQGNIRSASQSRHLHSYITERYQKVAVESTTSTGCVFKCSAPHVSVLGPILCCLYTRPKSDIVARHGMQYHCYADDTDIYMTVEHEKPLTAAKTNIEQCVAEVIDWLEQN